MPTRCFWPPESLRREGIALVRQADLGEQCLRLVATPRLSAALHLDRRLHDVLQHGQVRPQREMLEHHADARAHARTARDRA